ncbi:hypothetical protein IVB38_38425 [Bradyrhizobium sp. 38]|uniref:hypothetical protein n=1 Tax=unclassified Bradyrhizobium TaxID=2631580 RepID=UPI001FFA198E|nr:MULTISPECIES: hypothetical protein [unclassified Bradyrhizobium]MCK1341699.1 hypothetical protein [Bradyrhizobium sp. 38]MCK1777146.1 hypothetical protein [Bradyrhizobium sp. 132]
MLMLGMGMMMPVMMPLTMIVGMPMSSSIMRITIMVPPMIGAGYAGLGLSNLTVRRGPRCLS